MFFFENRSKPLEIQTLFHLGNLNIQLLELSETLEIQTLFEIPQQSQNCTFDRFQEIRCFKNIAFWKSCRIRYTKWYFRFQIHWEFIYFLNGIQKTFVFKNIALLENHSKPLEIQILFCSKTIRNSYTFWLISGKCSI